MKDMIYQLFTLDGIKQERVDSLKSTVGSQGNIIESTRAERLINFLKERYPVILVPNLVRAGVYTHIIVGADIAKSEKIEEDFAEITGELELFFKEGVLLPSENIEESEPFLKFLKDGVSFTKIV